MKRNIWLILGSLALVGIIAGVLIYVFYVNKSHMDVDNSKPAFELSAEALHTAFVEDSIGSMSKFVPVEGEKKFTILVSGTVSEVVENEGTYVVLLTIPSDDQSNIKCEMDPTFNERVKSIEPGTSIKIKGVCVGSDVATDMMKMMGENYTDVQLTRCVIPEE